MTLLPIQLRAPLGRFPTKTAMLTLLRTWLYAAEREGLDEVRPDYLAALRHAVAVMEQSSEPVRVIAVLQARETAGAYMDITERGRTSRQQQKGNEK